MNKEKKYLNFKVIEILQSLYYVMLKTMLNLSFQQHIKITFVKLFFQYLRISVIIIRMQKYIFNKK